MACGEKRSSEPQIRVRAGGRETMTFMTQSRQGEFHRTMLAVPAAVKQARDLAAQALTHWRQPQTLIDNARIVASELATNAVAAKPHGEIRLRIVLEQGAIRT